MHAHMHDINNHVKIVTKFARHGAVVSLQCKSECSRTLMHRDLTPDCVWLSEILLLDQYSECHVSLPK